MFARSERLPQDVLNGLDGGGDGHEDLSEGWV
jgi:hypothetical protein